MLAIRWPTTARLLFELVLILIFWGQSISFHSVTLRNCFNLKCFKYIASQIQLNPTPNNYQPLIREAVWGSYLPRTTWRLQTSPDNRPCTLPEHLTATPNPHKATHGCCLTHGVGAGLVSLASKHRKASSL